jgi:hypothetical protein
MFSVKKIEEVTQIEISGAPVTQDLASVKNKTGHHRLCLS